MRGVLGFFKDRVSLQKSITIIFAAFLLVVSVTFIVFLISNFGVSSTDGLDIQQLIIIIGVLFTFASLIIALFGIINYFQSSEGLKRLTELELNFRYNSREILVMRIFLLFLSNNKIMKTLQDTTIVGPFLIHCFKIADSKDITMQDSESVFDIEVSFIELLKCSGGLNVCQEILKTLESLGILRNDYATSIAIFRRLISRYSKV